MPRLTKNNINLTGLIKPNSEGESDSFLRRAASILLCLSEGVDTVTEISKYCNLSPSTTHRILNSLAEPHFTIYDPSSRRYYLGPLVSRLSANPSSTHTYLIFCALGQMSHLLDVAGETVTLDIAIGIKYIHLHALHSKHSLKVQGNTYPTDELMMLQPTGASQKMLLSQLNDKDLEIALKINANRIKAEDPEAEPDIHKWKNQIKTIRDQGYSLTRGESIPGGLGISVPVYNYIHPVALTLIGPEYRMKPNVTAYREELLSSAKRLSDELLEIFSNKSGL